MPRKPKVQRTPEEKWQIVLEGLKSGNGAETCRNHQIAATLYYRWKDEAEKASLAGGWPSLSLYIIQTWVAQLLRSLQGWAKASRH